MDRYSLQLDPKSELCFQGPFTQEKVAVLRLTNPFDKKICFKVKTTAPKRYCVRPTCGTVDARSELAVQVVLQPFEYNPAERQKHKFLVQSVPFPSDFVDYDTLWKSVRPEDLSETKLRCLLDMPGYDDVDNAGEAVVTSEHPEKFAEHKLLASSQADDGSNISQLRQQLAQLKEDNALLKRENYTLKKEDVIRRRTAPSTEEPPVNVQISKALTQDFSQASNQTLLVFAMLFIAFGIFIAKTLF